MKVALSFPGCHRRGGVERVIFESANFLAGRGHETHVYASDFADATLHDTVRRHLVPPSKMIDVLNLFSFSRRTQRQVAASIGRPDVHGVFGIQCPRDGVLWVQSVHRAWLEISRRRRKWVGRARQAVNPFHPIVLALEERYYAGRNYRKLIALTEQVKTDLMRFYSVPCEDISVLPNGFSPGEFNHEAVGADRSRARRMLGISPDERALLFVANELERKGFAPLIRAMSSLKAERLRLIVVGRASLKPYEAELRRLDLFDRVIAVGPTSRVAEYFAASDIFALPTQYEAWGLVIVEALACGVPVLTSRLAGAAVAVNEGRSGELLDDPDDVNEIATKLRRLLRSEYESPAWISSSVNSFAWPTLLKTYEDILVACARTGAAA